MGSEMCIRDSVYILWFVRRILGGLVISDIVEKYVSLIRDSYISYKTRTDGENLAVEIILALLGKMLEEVREKENQIKQAIREIWETECVNIQSRTCEKIEKILKEISQ